MRSSLGQLGRIEMHTVGITLPPISSGMHINAVATREPPGRSWSKYKKVLIDNPRDSNLLQRQKLWNFQKLNRGAFRSQLTHLPDIPYRVHTNTVGKVSVGIQADFASRFSHNLRVIFPNLTVVQNNDVRADETENDEINGEQQLDKACSENSYDEFSDNFEDNTSVDDPGIEFDSVVRKQNASTMTDDRLMQDTTKWNKNKHSMLKSVLENSEEKSILKTASLEDIEPETEKKVVKFDLVDKDIEQKTSVIKNDSSDDEHEEFTHAIPKVEICLVERSTQYPRTTSANSSKSEGSSVFLPNENIGHSSRISLDNLSILDFISGNISDRSKHDDNRKSQTSRDHMTKRGKSIADPKADRLWFEKIVGDKNIIDVGTYENFARKRPNTEILSDSNTDKYIEHTKVSPRRNLTTQINEELPAYQSAFSKTGPNKNTGQNTVLNKHGARRRGISIGKFL